MCLDPNNEATRQRTQRSSYGSCSSSSSSSSSISISKSKSKSKRFTRDRGWSCLWRERKRVVSMLRYNPIYPINISYTPYTHTPLYTLIYPYIPYIPSDTARSENLWATRRDSNTTRLCTKSCLLVVVTSCHSPWSSYWFVRCIHVVLGSRGT